MKDFKQEQARVRLYLLGGLDEEGQQQVEERVMKDSGYKEEVLMIEDELLEDYLAGTLPEREREMFHQHYLAAPRQRQKLKIAQALNRYAGTVPGQPPVKRHWIRLWVDSFAARSWFVKLSWAAAGLVLIASSWIGFQAWQARSKQSDLEAELRRLNSQRNIQESPDPSVLAVTFAPLQLRERGDLKRIAITPGTKFVLLRIPLAAGNYQTYRVVFKVPGGPTIFRLDGLQEHATGQTRTLSLLIPAHILSTNDYLLTVSGLMPDGTAEDIGDHSLRVLVSPQ